MNVDLTGKRALVCGSTQGIGRAIAEALAERGAAITLVARNEKVLIHTLAELPHPKNQTHEFVVGDFARPNELAATVRAYVERSGPAHILVNNTGGPPSGPLLEKSVEDFERAFSMHVLCSHLLVQAVVPGMKEEGYGRIINITSTSVKEPIPRLGLSNSIRAAVANWAKTLAGELGPFGITVNNVLPGFTDTKRLAELFERMAHSSGRSVDQVRAEAIETIPLRRLADPKETASVVAFLASAAASYVSGINLPVDGGRTGSL